MKAVRFHQYGDPSVLVVEDIETPKVSEGKVLVKVQAASLNPFDTAVRSGAYQAMIPLTLPVTIGGDIAGTVAEIGPGVTGFAVGDTVYGQANVVAGNSGAMAEYALTSAAQLAKAPSNVSIEEAAALPLVAVSAWQGLTEHITLSAGTKLLIQGGSGGIGSIAIQLAKHFGAYVATTVPTNDVEYAKSLGADEVIDYQTQKFQELLSGYDAVFDTAGGEVFNDSLAVLRSGGTAVSMIAQADEDRVKALGVTATTQATKVTQEALQQIAQLVEQGILQVRIDSTFKLADIQKAYEKRESGHTAGKIVVTL